MTDGTTFDSSIPRAQPFSFVVGQGNVIQGWDLGLIGACSGEKRKLTIPPELGYGEAGVGPIPGGATLLFDVEVVSITDNPSAPPPDNPSDEPLFFPTPDEDYSDSEYSEEQRKDKTGFKIEVLKTPKVMG